MRNFNSRDIRTFDIPLEEESVAVLEFIGLVPDTARLIYQRYADRPDPEQCPDDLMAYVRSHICLLRTKAFEALSHRNALVRIGVNPAMQDSILDPNHEEVFRSQSLHYWVQDTLQANHAALISRQGLLRNFARRTLKEKKKQK